eukprot:g18994.t3
MTDGRTCLAHRHEEPVVAPVTKHSCKSLHQYVLQVKGWPFQYWLCPSDHTDPSLARVHPPAPPRMNKFLLALHGREVPRVAPQDRVAQPVSHRSECGAKRQEAKKQQKHRRPSKYFMAFINDAIETKENQCKEGYDEKSEGCSRCAASYGRQREDPFQCKKCRKPWLQWLAYVAKPTGIYAVSLWTAQKVEKGRLGSLLKIWLAFGVVVASILPSITSSHRVEAVHAHFAEFAKDSVETGGETASMATLISGPSYDCLLGGESASMTAWLGLSCAPMLVLWVLTVLWVLVQSMQLQETEMQMQRLMEGALKTSIVIINCFLPDVVAALMRFFPCMHFQYPERSHRYLQFDVTTKCHDVIPQRIGAILSAFSLGALLGPVYWLMVVQKSKEWPNRKLTLGFLISGYKEKVCWWEATVLVRKCAVAVVIATFSATYSPMLYLSNLLMVVGTALACHAFVQPYNDKFLNKLEFGTLMASFVAVFCTCLLKLESLDWAADRAVTIPALVVLFVAVTVPSGAQRDFAGRGGIPSLSPFEQELQALHGITLGEGARSLRRPQRRPGAITVITVEGGEHVAGL